MTPSAAAIADTPDPACPDPAELRKAGGGFDLASALARGSSPKSTPSANASASASTGSSSSASAGSSPSAAASASPSLRIERRSIAEIGPETWDRLAARTAWATPFSRWAFHRAWWDAYGDNAHEDTLVVVDPAAAGADPVAIVPLMHRHGIEIDETKARTRIRADGDALTPLPPNAKVVFFGATYHSDYATVLADPADLPAVSESIVEFVAAPDSHPDFALPWDAIDLRRLRCGDPAADELTAAFERRAPGAGWAIDLEREDVCPVIPLPDGADIDAYLATLPKRSRHEIRRKVRRAEGAGRLEFVDSADPIADLESFIELHQKRWGAKGLFPPSPGGDQSRVLFRRLFELFDGRTIRLAFLTIDGQRIAAGITFQDGDSDLYFNAGVEPDALDLSPGVVLLYRTIVRALSEGKHRLDMLRGDERYKYDWGAVDEPIQRLLVRRATG